MAISPAKLAKILLGTVLFALLIVQGLLLSSRYVYQQGISYISDNALDKALSSFEKSESMVPDLLGRYYAPWDIYRIHLATGKTLNQIGQGYLIAEEVKLSEAFETYRSAWSCFEQAKRIDSSIYDIAFSQAQTEASLFMIYKTIYPEKRPPYDPHTLYRKAIQLRPNGITILYSYAMFLAYRGNREELGKIIRRMTEAFPIVYGKLKTEYFWADSLVSKAEAGLKGAIEKDISPREAHQALADIYSQNMNYDQAVFQYQASLDIRSFTNIWRDYLHMGRLQYLAGNINESEAWFLKGLETTTDFKSALNIIYYFFKQKEQLSDFVSFATCVASKLLHPPELDFAISRAWISLKKYPLAKARLLRLTAKKQTAEACYLLAKIAQQEQDLEQMELLAHRATVLDKDNSLYYHLFSEALRRQKKYPQAEEAATKALETTKKENHWLFNNRAWTRWAQQKYEAAAMDWKRAFYLKSDNAEFPYYIAQCYERVDRFEEAQVYVTKALALSPDNALFQKLRQRLK